MCTVWLHLFTGITEPDHPKKHKLNFIDVRDDIVAREVTHFLLNRCAQDIVVRDLCGAPQISSNYLKMLTWKESVQSINKIVIDKLYSYWPWYWSSDSHIGLRPAASPQYDCPQRNTKASMNTVN